MLTGAELSRLCRSWAAAPIIVRGILRAHVERGGEIPLSVQMDFPYESARAAACGC